MPSEQQHNWIHSSLAVNEYPKLIMNIEFSKTHNCYVQARVYKGGYWSLDLRLREVLNQLATGYKTVNFYREIFGRPVTRSTCLQILMLSLLLLCVCVCVCTCICVVLCYSGLSIGERECTQVKSCKIVTEKKVTENMPPSSKCPPQVLTQVFFSRVNVLYRVSSGHAFSELLVKLCH